SLRPTGSLFRHCAYLFDFPSREVGASRPKPHTGARGSDLARSCPLKMLTRNGKLTAHRKRVRTLRIFIRFPIARGRSLAPQSPHRGARLRPRAILPSQDAHTERQAYSPPEAGSDIAHIYSISHRARSEPRAPIPTQGRQAPTSRDSAL